MTRLQFKSVAILFFFSSLLYSQKISFDISGNTVFPKSQYKLWLNNIKAKSNEALKDSILSRLSANLSDEGYLNFKIDTLQVLRRDSLNTLVKIKISEGKPTVINNIILSGLTREDSLQIIPYFRFLKGRVFSKSEIEIPINKVLTNLENNGYPFAEIKIRSVVLSQDSANPCADVYLKIEKGELARVDKIEVEGNKSTKDDVIIREFKFDKGEKYSEKKINLGLKALQKLDYFSSVSKPLFYLTADGKGVLKVRVKEKSTNSFDGIIGYVPATNNKEAGYLTGYLNVSLRNLFGTGRAFAFRWLQENKNSQELELKYLEPWVFDFPVNVNLSLLQRKQDTTYVKRNLNLGVTYLATERLSASLIVGSSATVPLLSAKQNYSVFNSSSVTSGAAFQYDSRDNLFAPTAGVVFKSIYKFTLKKIYGPKQLLTSTIKTKSNLQKLELGFSYYYSLFGRNIIALNLSGVELRGSQTDLSDLYLIGGANTIRGYREKQFACTTAAWSNLEYRYLLGENSFGFLFLDAGYYLKSGDVVNSPVKQSGLLRSYGLGFSLATGLGVLKVSYAVAKGNSLTEGFIHFGIHNRF